MPVGLALWHMRALQGSTTVRVSLRNISTITGISVAAARRGLHALEQSHIISVDRQPGQKPAISLHETPGALAPSQRGTGGGDSL